MILQINRLFLFLAFVSTPTTSCVSQNNTKQEEIILLITFANGFSEDTLSCHLNSCELVRDIILSSSESDGVTSLQIAVFLKGDSFVAKIFQGKEILCETSIGELIKLEIVMNGSAKTFSISPKQGIYISIDKNNNGFSFKQAAEEILYD